MKVSNKDQFYVKNNCKQRMGFSFSVLIRETKQKQTNETTEKTRVKTSHQKRSESFSKLMPMEQYPIIYDMNLNPIFIFGLY